jgi:AraC-like DNA-binding protein
MSTARTLAEASRAARGVTGHGPAPAGDAAPAAPAATITIPAPDATGRIDLCWSSTGSGTRTTLHELFPDAGVHLVFRHSEAGCRMVLLGPATEPAAVERAAGAEYLGIRFRAGQAPRLADVRCCELTDGVVELTRLGGVPIEAVAERLRALPELGSRQRVLEDLVRQEVRPLVEDERCRRATLLLEARRGRLRVDVLAAELGLHVRSLERLFLEAFGMTPKRMARLVRLRYVLGALHSGGFGSMAELAHACGYADQPHLIRDFKSLTGRLPGEEDAARSRILGRPGTRVVHRYRP